MVDLVHECRRIMPDVGVQIPPNLADWWPRLVAAGATGARIACGVITVAPDGAPQEEE